MVKYSTYEMKKGYFGDPTLYVNEISHNRLCFWGFEPEVLDVFFFMEFGGFGKVVNGYHVVQELVDIHHEWCYSAFTNFKG